MILAHYTIEHASVRNVNGDGTMKELHMELTTSVEDADGTFTANQHINVPVPYDNPTGDRGDLIGKVLTVHLSE